MGYPVRSIANYRNNLSHEAGLANPRADGAIEIADDEHSPNSFRKGVLPPRCGRPSGRLDFRRRVDRTSGTCDEGAGFCAGPSPKMAFSHLHKNGPLVHIAFFGMEPVGRWTQLPASL